MKLQTQEQYVEELQQRCQRLARERDELLAELEAQKKRAVGLASALDSAKSSCEAAWRHEERAKMTAEALRGEVGEARAALAWVINRHRLDFPILRLRYPWLKEYDPQLEGPSPPAP